MHCASRLPTKMTASALPSHVKYSPSFCRWTAFCQLGVTSVSARFGNSGMYLYSIFSTLPRFPSRRMYSESGLPMVIESNTFHDRTRLKSNNLFTYVVFSDSGVVAIVLS